MHNYNAKGIAGQASAVYRRKSVNKSIQAGGLR